MVMVIPCETQRSRNLPRLRQSAHLRDLQRDHIHGVICYTAHHHVDSIDHLIEDEGIGVAPDGQALIIRRTGLLDVHVDRAHGVRHTDRGMLRPARIWHWQSGHLRA
jgi:hypothetical protein